MTGLAAQSKIAVDAFDIKDSGEREEYESGMVRDGEEDKVDYTYVIPGPMLDRWANHLMKGAQYGFC